MKTELKKTNKQTNKIPKGDGNKNVTNHISKFTLLEASAFSLNFRRLPWVYLLSITSGFKKRVENSSLCNDNNCYTITFTMF